MGDACSIPHAVARSLTDADFTPAQADAVTSAVCYPAPRPECDGDVPPTPASPASHAAGAHPQQHDVYRSEQTDG